MERGRQAPNVNRFQLNPSSPVKVLTKVCARTHLFPHSAINGSCSISPYSILPIRNLNKIRGRTQAQNELEQGVLCSVWSEPVGRHYTTSMHRNTPTKTLVPKTAQTTTLYRGILGTSPGVHKASVASNNRRSGGGSYNSSKSHSTRTVYDVPRRLDASTPNPRY